MACAFMLAQRSNKIMKTTTFALLCLLLPVALSFGQGAPNSFNYSAVARSATGDLISNTDISVRISVLEGSPVGAVVYQEGHSVTSNAFGIMHLAIGTGLATVGSLSSVDWSSSDHYLSVAIDVDGGTNYAEMGVTQILSVPYAIHSSTASSLESGSVSVSNTGDTLFVGGSFVVIPGISSNNGGPGSEFYVPGDGVTDIEGNTYPTIVMANGQEWMAENLRTGTYANGDPIPNVQDNLAWSQFTSGAWCHFDNDPQYEADYGKMYNWYVVADPRNVCPTGWHIPSDDEMNALVTLLGGEFVAGGKMKETGSDYWLSPNRAASNVSGFSGRGAGARLGLNGQFGIFQELGCWWTTLEENATDAYAQACDFNDGTLSRAFDPKTDAISLRCLKD